MTTDGPFTLGVRPGTLHVGNRGPAKPDPAVVELSELLRRHSIGSLTLNGGADAASWRTLLTLLARPPEDVRADGGIAHLWTTAGGPSVEIKEIDYAEVLREKQGDAATIERVLAAALSGPSFDLDEVCDARAAGHRRRAGATRRADEAARGTYQRRDHRHAHRRVSDVVARAGRLRRPDKPRAAVTSAEAIESRCRTVVGRRACWTCWRAARARRRWPARPTSLPASSIG